ncbi:hypothetical protein M0811_00645 [Anaeramoeba ignava]|uniref:PH domain-containing protein n=1 Tax=Anaeramoeba ignava TaxID=1746090 RepID=A0A9Q0LJK4_ANAIG|nr:hypothetical protein M0811_00645 [Anaeramoeba ignava]
MDFSELKKATPLGVINLAHTSIKQTLPKEVSKKNCFKIEHPLSRTYFCSASNENQMNEWISVLTQTINYIQATIPKHEEKNDWLTKQGGKHKSWKKRYFMLKYNTLYYFNSQSQLDKPLGQINLVNASIIMTDYTINIPNSFAILSKNRRTYIMYANSAQERDEWITSIRQQEYVSLVQMKI